MNVQIILTNASGQKLVSVTLKHPTPESPTWDVITEEGCATMLASDLDFAKSTLYKWCESSNYNPVANVNNLLTAADNLIRHRKEDRANM